MAGGSGHGDHRANRAGNRAHDTDGKAFIEQNRTLLDVDLEVPEEFLAAAPQGWDLSRIETRLAHGCRQGYTASVAAFQQLAVEPSRHSAAAEEARRETHPLFFRECDHVEVKRQFAAQPVEVLRHHHCGEDAEPPIVFAGVAHGVVMRGKDECWRRLPARGVAPNHVCDRVDLGEESCAPHQRGDFRCDRAMRRREISTAQTVRAFRPLREPIGKLHDALAEGARLAADLGRHLDHHMCTLFSRRSPCKLEHVSVILPRLTTIRTFNERRVSA